MRWRPQPKPRAIIHSGRDNVRNTTHTHLQIRGNQQLRDVSVWNWGVGGGRGGIPAPKIQFSPSAPVSLVEIDELVRKKKKQIYEALCVMALWDGPTQRHMRVNTCQRRHRKMVKTHKDGNLCGYLDFRRLIWFLAISFWGWCQHWSQLWSTLQLISAR